MARTKKPVKKIRLKGPAAIEAVEKMQAEDRKWKRAQMRKLKMVK